MYDKGKIVAGLIIFVALMTLPFWFHAAVGAPGAMPELARPTQPWAKDCVLPAAEMREQHMDLLNTWRDEYVREGSLLVQGPSGQVRTWADTGKPMMKSLSNTCIRCHSDSANFCDKCHAYAGVKPYCWDCHVLPTGSK